MVDARLQALITGENSNKLLHVLVHLDEYSGKVTLVVETPKSVFKECSRIVNYEH